jgi:hypothetical protein
MTDFGVLIICITVCCIVRVVCKAYVTAKGEDWD